MVVHKYCTDLEFLNLQNPGNQTNKFIVNKTNQTEGRFLFTGEIAPVGTLKGRVIVLLMLC